MKVKIEKLDHQGKGITYVDNIVTFVPKCVPLDEVKITITDKKKKYNIGKVDKLLKASPNRVKAFCPYYDLCGGCDLQNLSYKDTLEYKKDKVINIFKRYDIDINPIIISNNKENFYRNKIVLKVKDGNVGFYQKKTNSLVEIEKCMITKESINKVIPLIKTWGINNGEVTIRCNYNEEILIIINSKDNVYINIDKIKENIKLVGIVINDNTFYGENYLFERINGLLFKVSYDSFFQINHDVAAKLFSIVEENINKDEKVLDLYSGVGTLTLTAARKNNEVVGIEIIPNAVLNSILNAKLNKLDNVHFVLNDVEEAITKINKKFDTWIVDPPRSGIDTKTKNILLNNLPKKVIYVSCDPHTLARDYNILKEKYIIEKTYVLDMFSYTYHVESICVLKLKEN